MAIRLHIFAIPHAITRDEFSNCAYVGKVKRFAPMMMSRGFEVYHYGIETSESGATKQIDLLTKDEWQTLRIASYKHLNPTLTDEEVQTRLADPTRFIGELANFSTPLYDEFNRRLRVALQANYRSTKTDIVCLPFGKSHNAAIDGLNVIPVESGIGYDNSSRNYRIFESYAWMHTQLGKENKWGQNYWFVVPNYFDVNAWPLSLTPHVDTVGFFGRVYSGKGCAVVSAIAKRFPHVRFILCGQGDAKPFMTEPNVHYKPPIYGEERSKYLGSLQALVAPTQFIEPFCGAAVECQLCGTPAITVDFGAQTETIENFKTGLRCHTLQDFCVGVQMALDGKFDREYIRERAVKLYGMEEVGKKYEYTFKSIMDIHNGKNGWYSPDSYIDVTRSE